MINSRLVILACALAAAFPAFSQALAPSARKPTADGVLKADEYSYLGSYAGMRLGLSVSADGKTLYVALEAQTAGWVAVGLGSQKMEGAFLVLGFEANGKATISEESGIGHFHKPNAVKKLSAGVAKETAGVTVLEFALPAAGLLGGPSLKLMIAYGAADNLMSMHTMYKPLEIPLSAK
jgi:hypothetical protein